MREGSQLRMLALLLALGASACAGGGALRPFPRGPALSVDGDRDPMSFSCRAELVLGSWTRVCAPEVHAVPGGWDIADAALYSPMSRGLGIELAKPSTNVNALDEVPDSAWFENRVSLTEDDVFRGACKAAPLEPPSALQAPQPGLSTPAVGGGASPTARMLVDDAGLETNRPIFRLHAPSDVILRGDIAPDNERATAAAVIASRLAWAAGYNVPCEDIVYVPTTSLDLKPGLVYPDTRISQMLPLTQERFASVLGALPHKEGRVRLQWSSPVPGYAIGQWRFEGFRRDLPGDVVPHENRREIRGSRILAAWLAHYEIRAKNTMSTFISLAKGQTGISPGVVRHYLLDFSDSFGAPSESDAAQRRIGHTYQFDLEHVGADFATLGLLSRPWYSTKLSPFPESFGYFSAELFDPVEWKPNFPNPAYSFMQDEDAAWMARVLARVTPELVRAAVGAGHLSNAAEEDYLLTQLLRRRAIILRRYFELRSPLAEVKVEGRRICAQDIGRRSGALLSPGYSAHHFRGADAVDAGALSPKISGDTICVEIPWPKPGAFDGMTAKDLRRYLVVDLTSTASRGTLRVHLYDQGVTQGLELVGLERPADRKPPR